MNSQADTLGLDIGTRLGPLPTDGEDVDISAILNSETNHIAVSESETSWRVRTPRGVIYEASTEAEVIRHIESADEPSRLEAARGLGPFRSIDTYAEFTALVGGSSIIQSSMSELLEDMSVAASMNSSINTTGYEANSTPGSLELDLKSASHRHSGVLEHRVVRRDWSNQTSPKPLPKGKSEKTVGTGFVAIVLLVCLFTALSIVPSNRGNRPVIGGESAPAVVATFESKQIARANRAMKAGSYTTAAKILEGLSKRSKNPTVYKNLAIVLARTNRPSEAKRALETYRQLVDLEE